MLVSGLAAVAAVAAVGVSLALDADMWCGAEDMQQAWLSFWTTIPPRSLGALAFVVAASAALQAAQSSPVDALSAFLAGHTNKMCDCSCPSWSAKFIRSLAWYGCCACLCVQDKTSRAAWVQKKLLLRVPLLLWCAVLAYCGYMTVGRIVDRGALPDASKGAKNN